MDKSFQPHTRRSSSSSSSSFIVVSDEEFDQTNHQNTPDANLSITSQLPNQPIPHTLTNDIHAHGGVSLKNEDNDINEADDENGDNSEDENLEESDTDEIYTPPTATYHRSTDFDDISMGSADESEDDLLSMESSDDITAEPPIVDHFPRRRTNPKSRDPPVFHVTLPSIIIHSIFAFLDHDTLHLLLTISKGWFQYAANHLYRDPFGTIGRAKGRTDKSELRPTKERLLVRLLLRSIRCPSEPGEETSMDIGAMDSDNVLCKIVNKYGVEIKTTVNYMKFLEVFEWAPMKRYLDYWSQQLAVIDEYGEFFTCPSSIVPSVQVFRFSYHTLLDWFSENPNARAIVLHPEMEIPLPIVKQLPKWKTLYFDQTTPGQYYGPRKDHEFNPVVNPHYCPVFNNLSLIQSLFEHTTAFSQNGGGVKDFQIPSPFYFDENYTDGVETVLNLIAKPTSLDVSAHPSWNTFQLDLPGDIFRNLERLVHLSSQDVYMGTRGFLSKCPNLKEIDMVGGWDEFEGIYLPKLEVLRVYVSNLEYLNQLYETLVRQFKYLRVLKVEYAPERFRAKPIYSSVVRTEYNLMKGKFVMPNLEELYIRLDSRTRIPSTNPFGSCPQLKRLTLVSNEYIFTPLDPFQVPSTITDLVLDGVWIQAGFDYGCIKDLPQLRSLTLLHSSYKLKPPSEWENVIKRSWKPSTIHQNLETLRLSGKSAGVFRFEWLDLFPSLKTLEVEGLDYNAIYKGNLGITDDGEDDSVAELREGRGPRFCTFTVINAEVLQKSTEDTINYLVKKAKIWNLADSNASAIDSTTSLEQLFKSISLSRVSIDPPTRNDILNVLRRYCPAIQSLRMDFEGYSEEATPIPVEIPLCTVSRLKSYLPNLSRFRTDSYTINNTKLEMFRLFGFLHRADHVMMDDRVEDCVYKFAEADYLKSVRL